MAVDFYSVVSCALGESMRHAAWIHVAIRGFKQHLFDGRTSSYESKLQPKIEQIFETYPMLKFVGWMFQRSDINKVKDYINLVG